MSIAKFSSLKFPNLYLNPITICMNEEKTIDTKLMSKPISSQPQNFSVLQINHFRLINSNLMLASQVEEVLIIFIIHNIFLVFSFLTFSIIFIIHWIFILFFLVTDRTYRETENRKWLHVNF